MSIMDWTTSFSRIEFEDQTVNTPYRIQNAAEVAGVLVVLLSPRSDRVDAADVDLPSVSRNVLGYDIRGNLQWVVPDPTQSENPDDGSHFIRLYRIGQDIILKHTNGQIYRLDPESGNLTDSWPHNYLPLPSTTVELDGEVEIVIDDGERVFVWCTESNVRIYAFDKKGTELWKSEGYRGKISQHDGEILERVPHGPRSETWYRLDKATGERLEEVENPHSSNTGE